MFVEKNHSYLKAVEISFFNQKLHIKKIEKVNMKSMITNEHSLYLPHERDKYRENVESSSRTEVSIVIPAYNEELSVSSQIRVLHKVMQQTDKSYEIIVVNDGSTDDTEKQIAKEKVKLISLPRNRGYGAALKIGIARAKSELILIKGRGVSEEDRGAALQAHGDPEAPGLSLGQWQQFAVVWF